jgi:inositol transport system substrate-binding protein
MKTRNLFVMLIVAFFSMVILACNKGGEEKKDGYTVGYVNLADTDFWLMKLKNEVAKASEGTNITVQFADPNNDLQKQLDQADVFISRKVDLLVLVAIDSVGIVPAIKKANEVNIPVICLVIPAKDGNFTFVGSEHYMAGKLQGELFAKILPVNAKILYLAGTSGMDNARLRKEGFNDTMLAAGRTDVTTLSDMDGDFVRAKGMQITEDWIQTFPQFDAIISANDQMALGAVEALKNANRINGVFISGVDATDEACQAVKDGFMVQTVLLNAPGIAKACMDTIQKILSGQAVEKDVVVPFESITRENIDQYM